MADEPTEPSGDASEDVDVMAVLAATYAEMGPPSLPDDDPSVADLNPSNIQDVHLIEPYWPLVSKVLAAARVEDPRRLEARLHELRAVWKEFPKDLPDVMCSPAIALKLQWIEAMEYHWQAARGRFDVDAPRSTLAARRLEKLARDRGENADDPWEDPDLLHLIRHWELPASFAAQRAGRMLLEPNGEARLRGILEEAGRERRRALEAAEGFGLGPTMGAAGALVFGIEDVFWVTESGRRVVGLDPEEEGRAWIGRLLLVDDTLPAAERSTVANANMGRIEQAAAVKMLVEAWEESPEWTRRELRMLMARHQLTTFREALEYEPIAAALMAGAAARKVVRDAEAALRFTDVVAMQVLGDYWGEFLDDAKATVAKKLEAGEVVDLEDALRRGAVEAEKAFREHFHGEADLVASMLSAAWGDERFLNTRWSPDRVRRFVGALDSRRPGPESFGMGQVETRVDALRSEGLWPAAVRQQNLGLADVAEWADLEGTTLREELAALEVGPGGREELLAELPGRLDRIAASRADRGLSADACLGAFASDPRWWPDDARRIAQLRGVDVETVEEWMGRELLLGRDDALSRFVVDERVLEQALYRTEEFGRPYVILLLQGGGAKAAYQLGVFDALEERGLAPSWVLGISSGALNAAVYAGNPVGRQRTRLDRLWSRLTNRMAPTAFFPRTARPFAKIAGAMAQIGMKPDFYRPHGLPPQLYPPGTDGAVSWFTNDPLEKMLNELVDWSRIEREAEIHRRTTWSRRNANAPVRLTVGTTQIRTGEFVWWDSVKDGVGVKHVLASGAMPPGAPGIEIDGKRYWDGGVVGNNPLQPVLDEMLGGNLNGRDVLVVFVDLWGSEDWEPTTLAEVQLRKTQLEFAGRVDASIDQFRANLLLEVERRRRMPKGRILHNNPYAGRRRGFGALDPRSLAILRIENGRRPDVGHYDPMDFSADSIAARRAAGAGDMSAALTEAPWEDDVKDDRIGGAIHHFRQGRLVGSTSAIDVAEVPRELLE